MARRIGRKDLSSTRPFVDEEYAGFFVWRVYEDFDIIEPDGGLPYYKASINKGEYYRPFEDTPYLFLEFARLLEQKSHPMEALDKWLTKYGLLGLSHPDTHTLERVAEVTWVPKADWTPELSVPPLRYEDAGGPGDTLNAYVFEISRANKLLILYEALLNKDVNRLEQFFAYHEGCTTEVLKARWGSRVQKAKEENLNLKDGVYFAKDIMDDVLIYPSLPNSWNSFLVDKALFDIWSTVGAALSAFTYPSITSTDGSGPLTPHKLTSTWRARNLLGALYLQFHWLITSAAELTRCKNCGGIISHAQPNPESGQRKPRKDKEFCGSRCRQNYHYQNRVKPDRKKGLR
jgi:hypothetical protein